MTVIYAQTETKVGAHYTCDICGKRVVAYATDKVSPLHEKWFWAGLSKIDQFEVEMYTFHFCSLECANQFIAKNANTTYQIPPDTYTA